MASLVRVFIAVLLSVALVKTGAFAQSSTDEKVSWVRKTDKNDTVIVFVHGFDGHQRGTWHNKDEYKNWFDIIERDSLFDKSDIALYGYRTNQNNPEASIEELANYAKQLFEVEDLFKYPNIVFVAHSLGGLVVKTILVGKQSITNNSRVILHLFGVPAQGQELATAYKLLYGASDLFIQKQPRHLDQIVLENSRALLNFINYFWDSISDRLKVYCYFEGRATPIQVAGATTEVMVIDRARAQIHCSENKSELSQEDHISMVKPDGRNSDIHKFFRKNWMKQFAQRTPAEHQNEITSTKKRRNNVFIDSHPGSAEKFLRKLGSKIPYLPGGIYVEPGKYLASALSGGLEKSEVVDVGEGLSSRIIYLEEWKDGSSPQICVLGEPGGMTIELWRDGEKRRSYTTRKKNSSANCSWSQARIKSTKYRVRASHAGYATQEKIVDLSDGTKKFVRFHLQPDTPGN